MKKINVKLKINDDIITNTHIKITHIKNKIKTENA